MSSSLSYAGSEKMVVWYISSYPPNHLPECFTHRPRSAYRHSEQHTEQPVDQYAGRTYPTWSVPFMMLYTLRHHDVDTPSPRTDAQNVPSNPILQPQPPYSYALARPIHARYITHELTRPSSRSHTIYTRTHSLVPFTHGI